VVSPCLIGFTYLEESITKTVQRVGFQSPVTDPSGRGECLLKVVGSLLVVAECQVYIAELDLALGSAACQTRFME
jgi:hypothetical protein